MYSATNCCCLTVNEHTSLHSRTWEYHIAWCYWARNDSIIGITTKYETCVLVMKFIEYTRAGWTQASFRGLCNSLNWALPDITYCHIIAIPGILTHWLLILHTAACVYISLIPEHPLMFRSCWTACHVWQHQVHSLSYSTTSRLHWLPVLWPQWCNRLPIRHKDQSNGE